MSGGSEVSIVKSASGIRVGIAGSVDGADPEGVAAVGQRRGGVGRHRDRSRREGVVVDPRTRISPSSVVAWRR